MNTSGAKEKFGTNSRYDCCTEVSCRPLSGCFRFAWSPGFPWLLGSRCSSCPVRGVAPNLRIQSLIREFSTAIACGVCLTFSPFLLEFISRLVALHSVHYQFVFAHLANEQVLPLKQILFCGAMVPTLLPVRPGLHSMDVGLL